MLSDVWKSLAVATDRFSKNIPYVEINREVTENIPDWTYYLQLDISNSQLGIIYPIRENIANWGKYSQLGIYESNNAESENKSIIPNWLNITNLERV